MVRLGSRGATQRTGGEQHVPHWRSQLTRVLTRSRSVLRSALSPPLRANSTNPFRAPFLDDDDDVTLVQCGPQRRLTYITYTNNDDSETRTRRSTHMHDTRFGMMYINGPWFINPDFSLRPNPGSWSTHYGMLFVEQPIGVGFSSPGDQPIPDDELPLAEGESAAVSAGSSSSGAVAVEQWSSGAAAVEQWSSVDGGGRRRVRVRVRGGRRRRVLKLRAGRRAAHYVLFTPAAHNLCVAVAPPTEGAENWRWRAVATTRMVLGPLHSPTTATVFQFQVLLC